MTWLKENWFKLTIATIVAITFGITIYFGFARENKQSQEISFVKKQECQKLQSELEKKLNVTYTLPLYRSVILDKIFYSSVKDSCLYTFRVWGSGGDSPNFYLKDALTNDELFSVTTPNDIILFGKYVDIFDEAVRKYGDVNSREDELPEAGKVQF